MHAFILKFRNCDSYLYGVDQLLYFQDIRDALKFKRPIEVVVTVIEKNAVDSNFPPLLNQSEDTRAEQEKLSQKMNKVTSGVFSVKAPFSKEMGGTVNAFGFENSSVFEQDQFSSPNAFAYSLMPLKARGYSIMHDILKKKEHVTRMQQNDFKLQKYK